MSFKVHTIVATTVILLCGPFAQSDTSKNANSDSSACAVKDGVAALMSSGLSKTDALGIYNSEVSQQQECLKTLSDKSSGTCDSANSDFSDANKEFTKDCGEISSHPDCLSQFPKCDAHALDSAPATAGTNGVPSAASLSAQYKNCPVFAGSDLDKFKDELDKHKKKREDLQDRQDKVQDSITQAQNTAQDKVRDLNKQIRDENAQFAKDMADAAKEQSDGGKQLIAKMTQLQADIVKNGDRERQASTDRKQAMADLAAAQGDIENDCLQKAGIIISKMQDKAVAQMSNRLYFRGTSTQLFRNQGLTDEQYWQNIENRLIQKCRNSPETALKNDRANKIYAVNTSKIDDEVESARKMGQMLAQQMNQLKDNLPCTISTSEACMDARAAQQQNDARTQAHVTSVQGLQSDVSAAYTQGQQAQTQKSNEAMRINNELGIEDQNITDLNAALDAKYAAGATSNDDGAASKAYSAFHSAREAALMVMSCARKTCDDACMQAASFAAHAVAGVPEKQQRYNDLAKKLGITTVRDGSTSTTRTPTSTNSTGSGTQQENNGGD